MTDSWKALKIAGVVAALTLSGCGSSTGSGSDATAGGQSAGASKSPAAPETPKIDLKATAPQGKYRLVEKLASVEPRSAAAEWKGTTNGVLKGSWQVLAGHCTETACSGLIKSSFGSVATYSWDGSKLTIKRDDDLDGLCRSGSGTVKTTYHYSYDLQVSGPSDGPPESIQGPLHVDISYGKRRNCAPSKFEARVLVQDLQATRVGD